MTITLPHENEVVTKLLTHTFMRNRYSTSYLFGFKHSVFYVKFINVVLNIG